MKHWVAFDIWAFLLQVSSFKRISVQVHWSTVESQVNECDGIHYRDMDYIEIEQKKSTKSKMLIDYYINRIHMFGRICYG